MQIFRRSESIDKTADLRLHDLEPEARYRVQNLDLPDADVVSGAQLMESGVSIVVNDRPGAVVIHYEKVGP